MQDVSSVEREQEDYVHTAKLFLESADLSDHVTVRAYGDLLKEIVKDSYKITCCFNGCPAIQCQVQ